MTESSESATVADPLAQVKSDYPARYYAAYDQTATEPTQITGWFDVWGMVDRSQVPLASAMLPITQADMPKDGSPLTPKAILSGKIVDYSEELPIKDQASQEMKWIQSEAALASAMGETFSADMRAYVKAIQSIIAGTDTTSTQLPVRPAQILVAS